MKEFWDERFSSKEYIYGEQPNAYLKQILDSLPQNGKALFAAEGEGRNAVYAAKLGWEVTAFDQSAEGKRKAELLADKNGVKIDYRISAVEEVSFQENSYDALVLIYTHFSEAKRRELHHKLSTYLKSGGLLIIEGFSKKHTKFQSVNPQAGGPKDVSMLYDLEEMKKDFEGFEFKEAVETETTLNEGEFHKGEASVVRIFAVKK